MMSAIETIKAIFLFNYEYKNIRWFTRWFESIGGKMFKIEIV